MVQTAKAQENQAGQQNQDGSQNQAAPLTQEVLQKLLVPLTETVAQLKADKEQEVAATVAAQEAAQQAQLNKDADISAMLDNVNVSDNVDDKYENMSKKQLVDVIGGAVESALESNATQIKNDIKQSMSKSTEKVAAIEKAVMSIMGKMSVDESRNKHSDFDDHKEAIGKIMGEIPNISFERAYLLAKSETAGDIPPKGQIDTEKPTDTAWSPEGNQGGTLPNQNALQTIADRGRDSREESVKSTSGTVGFRNILKAGMDKAIDDNR